MCLERLYSTHRLSVSIPLALCLAAMLAGATPRFERDQDRYDPCEIHALQDFSFELSPGTGVAGIRLEYSYPASWLQR